MKRVVLAILFSLILVNLVVSNLQGKQHHKEHLEHAKHKEQKSANRFKLSESAIKTLGIKLTGVGVKEKFEVPLSSLVVFQDELGVFVADGKWFEMVHVKLLDKNQISAFIHAEELGSNSKVASKGVSLLRVAHLQASGEGGHGHAH